MSDIESIEDEPGLVPKKGSTSVVWSHFGYKATDTEQKQGVFCKYCNKAILTVQGNTSNLFQHLRCNHAKEYEECMVKKRQTEATKQSKSTDAKRQPSIADAFINSNPYPTNSTRWNEITDSITFHIAKDMTPISTVEQCGFKKMVRTLDKRYNVPSRKYFSQTALPKLYSQCHATVATELKQVQHFAATTDLWSSRTSEPYMSLTVHYIDADWKLQNKCLAAVYFPQDHTGIEIAQGLKDSFVSWDLHEEKLACITTDSGANIVKAAELNKWTRLQCFGHRLHLAIGM